MNAKVNQPHGCRVIDVDEIEDTGLVAELGGIVGEGLGQSPTITFPSHYRGHDEAPIADLLYVRSCNWNAVGKMKLT